MGPWMWALNSLIIVGLGVVKLSAAFTLLPLADARSHSYLLMARAILLVGLMRRSSVTIPFDVKADEHSAGVLAHG
jgi:hypothetical protein